MKRGSKTPKPVALHHTHITLDVGLNTRLKVTAALEGVTAVSIIRRSLEEYLKRAERGRGKP
jgi:hypothetical protein